MWGADKSGGEEQMMLVVRDAQNHATLIHNKSSARGWADPSAVTDEFPVWGVPLFTAEQSVDGEEMRLLLREAKDHATSIYDESSAG